MNNLTPSIIEIRAVLDDESANGLLVFIGEFAEKLQLQIKDKNREFIYCLRAISISFDEIPDETTGLDELALVTADLILNRFAYRLYRSNSSSITSEAQLNACYLFYYRLILSQFSQLLNFPYW